MRPGLRLALALSLSASAAGAEIPEAAIVLESPPLLLRGHVREAAPPRFVLLDDDTVFVGGTCELQTGRLNAPERKELERRAAEVRKLPSLTGSVTLGPGTVRRRLVLRKAKLDAVLTGDPAQAPPSLRPLATLVMDLERFHHASLRPYTPAFYALGAREEALPGGCRRWTRPEPLDIAVFAPRMIPSAGLGDWPTGATPSSVCQGGKKYVVTFRPLLPGERP